MYIYLLTYLLTYYACYKSFFRPPVWYTHNLRVPSADRRETLSHDRKLVQFYRLSTKIWWALPQKIGVQKHAKFHLNLYFIQPSTLITNISRMAQDIQNQKANSSKAIPPVFYEKGPVNFGALITEN